MNKYSRQASFILKTLGRFYFLYNLKANSIQLQFNTYTFCTAYINVILSDLMIRKSIALQPLLISANISYLSSSYLKEQSLSQTSRTFFFSLGFTERKCPSASSCQCLMFPSFQKLSYGSKEEQNIIYPVLLLTHFKKK